MAPLDPLLFLLITTASANTTISFYQEASWVPGSPSAGDTFRSDDLATGSDTCYMPSSSSVTVKIEEIDEGCSAYLDSTCSMPTSEAPTNLIGSFKAKCASSGTATTNNASATAGDHAGHAGSPGLQSPPTNAARSGQRDGWVDLGIRALMGMGAMEVVWGWEMP